MEGHGGQKARTESKAHVFLRYCGIVLRLTWIWYCGSFACMPHDLHGQVQTIGSSAVLLRVVMASDGGG
jgi:hypothetical protein